MANEYALPGRIALVTGAAQGIGWETARLLHARGCSVALVDIDSEGAERAADGLGDRALAIAADVTDAAAMGAAVTRWSTGSAASTWSSPTPASPRRCGR